MNNRGLLLGNLIIILLLFSITTPTQAQTNVSWGVDQGDTGVYFVDEITSSLTPGANLALVLLGGEENRTAYVTATSMTESALNYTLAAMDGSTMIQDQQINMTTFTVSDNDFIIPIGALPFFLPLAANSYNDYLEYLATQVSLANFAIDSLLGNLDGNFSFVEDINLSANYGDDLRLSLGATFGAITNITSIIPDSFNFTVPVELNQSQSITGGDLQIDTRFNKTDGMLTSFDFGASIDTQQNTTDGLVNSTLSFSIAISRNQLIRATDTSALQDAASSAAESPFLWLTGIFAIFLISFKRKLD